MAGRPSKFSEAVSEKMLTLYREGKTDVQVAKIIGITVRTIHKWKAKKVEFFHSIKEAKYIADELVEGTLFRRATGYEYLAEKIFVVGGQITRTKVLKHCPPDVTAQIFWLKNRRPDEWKSRTCCLLVVRENY